jgi:DNA-binding SARP family transcriptional activator/TolB-like protein
MASYEQAVQSDRMTGYRAQVMPYDLRSVYEQARERSGEAVWSRLSAHEQTVAVYQELRSLDADRAGSRDQWAADKDGFVSFASTRCVAVRLRLTGQMEAWTVANENVLPTGRKTRALLAAVALSAPRPASRGRLAELLWSRRPDEQARASLRQEIQLLLRALAPAKTEVLRVTREHLALAPGAVWVDVEEIMRATTSKPAALSLLDGELLEDLDGIDPTFDMWLTAERERLRDRARGMAETLLREQSDPAAVIPAAQRLLQIDRAHEEAWRSLMRAHAEQGERGMAIQAFDRCRAVLADLLDAEPSSETQSLLHEIRGPSSKRLPSRPPWPSSDPVKSETRAPDPRGAAGDDRPPSDGSRIGVLPLRSVGLPDDVAYLGPSFANEITTALTRFRRLSVVSPNSLSRLAHDNPDGTATRRGRDVDFLLDGAIQRSRNKLRVTLRLLDLNDDNQVVWARRFDRPADDLWSVQEDISGEVAAQINPIIMLTEGKRGAARSLAESSAHELVARSVPLILRMEQSGFMRAGELLTRAIETDPDHSEAYRWHAAWHVLLINQYWADNPRRTAEQATELAERGIVLDPWSGGAFTMAGHVRTFARRGATEGAALHERALQLNPNLAASWALSAITQIALGNAAEAERRYQRYKTMSPLDPYSVLFDGLFAGVHLLRRDHEAGVAAGRTVTELHPAFAAGYVPYLVALGHLGRAREAAVILRRLRVVAPDVSLAKCVEACPLERQADRDEFAEGLRHAGLS